MPTWVPNTDAVLKMDNDSNVLTDQSDYVTTVSQDLSVTVGEFFTFGLSGAQRSEGQRAITGSLGVRPATDAAGLHYQLLQIVNPGSGNKIGSKTIEIDYPDSTTGSYRLNQEVYISSYNEVAQDASGDGTPATHTMEYQVDGEPTLTVIT